MDRFFRYDKLGNIDSRLSHIDMLCKENIKNAQRLPAHKNVGIEICYVNKGVYRWEIQDVECRLMPGFASVTLPWQLHGGMDEELNYGILNWCILVPEHFAPDGKMYLGKWCTLGKREQNAIGKLLVTSSRQVFSGQEVIGDVFEQMNAELQNKMIGYVQRVNNLCMDMLLFIARNIELEEKKEKEDLLLAKIQRLVESDYGRHWSIPELCDFAHVKKTTLNDYFNQHTGYSPMLYIHMLKIEKAKQLLNSREVNATSIAMELGYSSSQHFLKMFKKLTGTTPRRYQKR